MTQPRQPSFPSLTAGRRGVLQGMFPSRVPPLRPAQRSIAQARPGFGPQAGAPHVAAAVGRGAAGAGGGGAATPQHFGQHLGQHSGQPVVHQPVQPFGQAQVFEVPPSLNLSGRSGGSRMPERVQRKMEGAFGGADFSDVRIHVGSEASAIGAIAFTHGSNIYFAQGYYNPSTPQGQQLLGHELTHVLQQRAGRVSNPLGSGVAVVQDPGMEAEAERMGMRIAMLPDPPSASKGAQAKPAPGSSLGAPAAGFHAPLPHSASAGAQPKAPGGAKPSPGGNYWVSRQSLDRGRTRLEVHRGGQSVGHLDVFSEEGKARVYNLKVDPAFRGQGAGGALLKAAARTGASMGYQRLSLDSEDNGSGRLTRWYQEEGFSRVGTNSRGMAVLEAPAQALMAKR